MTVLWKACQSHQSLGESTTHRTAFEALSSFQLKLSLTPGLILQSFHCQVPYLITINNVHNVQRLWHQIWSKLVYHIKGRQRMYNWQGKMNKMLLGSFIRCSFDTELKSSASMWFVQRRTLGSPALWSRSSLWVYFIQYPLIFEESKATTSRGSHCPCKTVEEVLHG